MSGWRLLQLKWCHTASKVQLIHILPPQPPKKINLIVPDIIIRIQITWMQSTPWKVHVERQRTNLWQLSYNPRKVLGTHYTFKKEKISLCYNMDWYNRCNIWYKKLNFNVWTLLETRWTHLCSQYLWGSGGQISPYVHIMFETFLEDCSCTICMPLIYI